MAECPLSMSSVMRAEPDNSTLRGSLGRHSDCRTYNKNVYSCAQTAVVEYPAEHCRHAVDPTADVYDPALHAMHTLRVIDASVLDAVPAGHLTQLLMSVLTSVSANVPAGHP